MSPQKLTTNRPCMLDVIRDGRREPYLSPELSDLSMVRRGFLPPPEQENLQVAIRSSQDLDLVAATL